MPTSFFVLNATECVVIILIIVVIFNIHFIIVVVVDVDVEPLQIDLLSKQVTD